MLVARMFDTITAAKQSKWKPRLAILVAGFVLAASFVWLVRMTQMPLRSYTGTLPPLSVEEAEIRDHLVEHTRYLSTVIGERNISRPTSLQATRSYLQKQLEGAGYSPTENSYQLENQTVSNLEITILGSRRGSGTLIVGAHYDTARGTTGANDNASGVAALLELARLLRGAQLRKDVRLVFFVNEEPPFFQTDAMGSRVYARTLRHDGVPVTAMISLETIGFYSDLPNSQKYPPLLSLLYPSRGNFIGFVGNAASRELVRKVATRFRESTQFPSEGIAAPDDWPGVGWSDQWSFWQEGYPAIMVTDTAPFRYPYYHTPSDKADKVDYGKMARVLAGVRKVVEALGNE